MANPFSYFELHTADLARAKSFYGKLFDWKIGDVPSPHPYAQIEAGPGPQGGMRGKLDHAPSQMWMPYFDVGDVDAAVAKATSLGAKVLVPRQDIPAGSYAIFSDPQGGTFAVFKGAER